MTLKDQLPEDFCEEIIERITERAPQASVIVVVFNENGERRNFGNACMQCGANALIDTATELIERIPDSDDEEHVDTRRLQGN